MKLISDYSKITLKKKKGRTRSYLRHRLRRAFYEDISRYENCLHFSDTFFNASDLSLPLHLLHKWHADFTRTAIDFGTKDETLERRHIFCHGPQFRK